MVETKTKQSPIPSYVIARIVCHRRPDNGPTVYHAVPCLLPFQDTPRLVCNVPVQRTRPRGRPSEKRRVEIEVAAINNVKFVDSCPPELQSSDPSLQIPRRIRHRFSRSISWFEDRHASDCCLPARSRVVVAYDPEIKIKAIKYLN